MTITIRWFFPIWLGLLLLTGCERGQDGPVAIHWDRDVCERCGMLISDRRFAAQLRDANGKPHLFDDVGDLVLWLHQRHVSDPSLPLYVMDEKSGSWLDARRARYSTGKFSPMGFGYAAHQEPEGEDLDFPAMAARVVAEDERTQRLVPPISSAPSSVSTP